MFLFIYIPSTSSLHGNFTQWDSHNRNTSSSFTLHIQAHLLSTFHPLPAHSPGFVHYWSISLVISPWHSLLLSHPNSFFSRVVSLVYRNTQTTVAILSRWRNVSLGNKWKLQWLFQLDGSDILQVITAHLLLMCFKDLVHFILEGSFSCNNMITVIDCGGKTSIQYFKHRF